MRKGEIKPENYKLRSIKVLGRIGNYLVMEHVENRKLDWDRYKKITEELRGNFLGLTRKDFSLRIPQTSDIIVPGKREQGKLVVYLPYDYY